MQHLHFKELFPEIDRQETRFITSPEGDPDFPADQYGLLEMYCTDIDCDCRRVMLSIVSSKSGKHHCTINFGWEPRSYYEQWMGSREKEVIDDLKGPCRNMLGPDSELSDMILEMVENTALKDKKYVERLERHYKMFKDKINAGSHQGQKPFSKAMEAKKAAVGRNELCPCGSGKKYKKCCFGKE
jgi:hypothetical protein